MKRKEDKERVVVPIRCHEAIPKKELPEDTPEPHEMKIQELPRRWYTY